MSPFLNRARENVLATRRGKSFPRGRNFLLEAKIFRRGGKISPPPWTKILRSGRKECGRGQQILPIEFSALFVLVLPTAQSVITQFHRGTVKLFGDRAADFARAHEQRKLTKFWENPQEKPLDFEKCAFLNQNSHFFGGQEGCRHPKKTHFCGGPQNLGGVATKCSGSPFCVQGVKGLHYPPRLAPAHVTRGRRLSAVGGRGVQKLESKEQMPWTLTWQ